MKLLGTRLLNSTVAFKYFGDDEAWPKVFLTNVF